MDESTAHRYLDILGIVPAPPGIGELERLVRAHLVRVPFENISKLYYLHELGLRDIPTIDPYLDGLGEQRFGGTCYSSNWYFHQLLTSLGYQALFCAADMNEPDVHAVNVVTLDGRRWLIDVGYAAPFYAPLPLDLAGDHEVSLGRSRYVLRPRDAAGRWRLDQLRDGQPVHGYTVKLQRFRSRRFREIIAHSFRDSATFLNGLLLARFFPDRCVRIHDYTLIESSGARERRVDLDGRDELVAAIDEYFGIPERAVRIALCELRELRSSLE